MVQVVLAFLLFLKPGPERDAGERGLALEDQPEMLGQQVMARNGNRRKQNVT